MPNSQLVSAGKLQLYVQDWGVLGKPLLVFLHGLASTSHMFDLIAPVLAADYHVLAVDQRGHGQSDKPHDGYDFEMIAQDLDNVLSAMNLSDEKLILAGHSWGASTVLYYAATRPERVSAAILIDGGVRAIQDRLPTWEEAEKAMAPPRMTNMDAQTLLSRVRERWPAGAFSPEVEPLLLSLFDLSNPADIHARLGFENHMRIAYHLWAFKPSDYNARIQCPVLIVSAVSPGSEIDPQMQRYADTAKQQLKHAEVVWMRDTMHDIPWHRPQELVEVIQRFLKHTI